MIIGALVAIVVIAGLVIAAAVEYDRRRKRAAFGPEYEALVEQEGSRRAADKELGRRRRAYANLALRPLAAQERDRYAQDWRQAQESFVDDPAAALNEAEALVVRLARFRGYPGGDGEALLELLSVPHAASVSGYREAIQVRQATETDVRSTSTEDMRQAFQKYAALFDEMLAAAGRDEGRQESQSSDSVSETATNMEVAR
ncbi:hypothetical protein ABH926_005866 [Catenulispora sp. GP43]|jgi:hypothetical protein|uniref:hypothetical protein n=1 Tax=Catenulispora sp. GP43 TaxID=3156263 RepID=UPI003513B61E